jgi:hypothetical protein
LSEVTRIVVSDSESEGVVSNGLMPEEGSVSTQFGLELEFNTVLERLSWVSGALLVNEPCLVKTVMAVMPNEVHVLSVGSTPHIEALASVVSDISSRSSPDSSFLGVVASVWLDDSMSSVFVRGTVFGCDCVVPLRMGSDGSRP